MTRIIEGTTTIRTAKQYDSNFNIATEKAEVVQQWTTPESELGYGYQTAELRKSKSYTDVYNLWLDGDLADVEYGIAIVDGKPRFAPMHELLSDWI